MADEQIKDRKEAIRQKRIANLTNAGKGRPKGAVNRVPMLAKQAIADAAESIGGAQRLAQWAKESPENEKVFWSSIYTKLIPVQAEVTGKDGGAIEFEQVQNDAMSFTRAIASLAARAAETGRAGETQH